MKKKKNIYLAGALAMIVVIAAVVAVSGIFSRKSVSSEGETTNTIPIISLDGECLSDYQNWNDKSTYYPAKLTYTDGDKSFTMDIEIKPQGTSSLHAPKKNFTVKFGEEVEFVDKWGAQKKYVLKADYIDPTCSGNVVSAKLAAEMNKKYGVLEDTPNYGVIDGFSTFVKINGEDAGIFNLTIPKDAWLFNMDESNPNHLVLACEGWSEASRLQTTVIDYEADWSFEVGEANDANKAAFERLVTFLTTADDETFVRDFDQYLDLDACLNYICYINAAYAKDNVAKNMLMVTYDGKVWYPTLYDLDSLWGIDAMGTGLMEADGAWINDLLSNGNLMLYRVNYYFGDQVRQRYQELRETILSKEHILESFEAYAARIPREYYDINNALWYTDGTRIRSVEVMSQTMDAYLPIMDALMAGSETAAPSESTGENQVAEMKDTLVHYVWEENGVQKSLEDIDALPVAASMNYTLNGKAISAEELAGKSGRLEATLRVERKASETDAYGVAAVVQLEKGQYKNIALTGGTHTKAENENADVCMGSAWLGNAANSYEMRLSMDVTDFDPAQYVVVISSMNGVYGGDGSLNALLAAASELTTIVNEGIHLHTSLVEWHTYLANIQTALEATGAMTANLISDEATAAMQTLLTAAEAEADALLEKLGYQTEANRTTEVRIQMLTKATSDSKATKEDQEQASVLLSLLQNYQIIANHLVTGQQAATEIGNAVGNVAGTMPDLVGAYGYANDTLYALIYKISTLYQNIANYYASIGGGTTNAGTGGWSDVIIFTSHHNLVP